MHIHPRECIQCPKEAPVCNCSDNEQCTLSVQTCTQCATAVCVKQTTAIGPILGGIIGGVALLSLVLVVAWLLRRHSRDPNAPKLTATISPREIPKPYVSPEMEKTRRYMNELYVDSVTSTSFSDSSNAIPIAYLPGIAQRFGDRSSGFNPFKSSVYLSTALAPLGTYDNTFAIGSLAGSSSEGSSSTKRIEIVGKIEEVPEEVNIQVG